MSFFPISRLIYNRDPDASDIAWLQSFADDPGFSPFIGVVRADISIETYAWFLDKGLCKTDAVDVLSKGPYATLLNGFWLVADRAKQVNLDEKSQEWMKALHDRNVRAMQNLTQPDYVDVQDLPPVAHSDPVSLSILILEKQSARHEMVIDGDEADALKRHSNSSKLVKECLKAIPNWTDGVHGCDAWMKRSNVLRAFRSRAIMAHLKQRVEESMSSILDPQNAGAFHEWLLKQRDENADVAAFLFELGVHIVKADEPSTMLPFMARLLSLLSSVPRPFCRGSSLCHLSVLCSFGIAARHVTMCLCVCHLSSIKLLHITEKFTRFRCKGY